MSIDEVVNTRLEQIIRKLREAELLSQGNMVGEMSPKLGVTEQTYYRWERAVRK
jgi:DNA-binding XRE family transcriptional regulator